MQERSEAIGQAASARTGRDGLQEGESGAAESGQDQEQMEMQMPMRGGDMAAAWSESRETARSRRPVDGCLEGSYPKGMLEMVRRGRTNL